MITTHSWPTVTERSSCSVFVPSSRQRPYLCVRPVRPSAPRLSQSKIFVDLSIATVPADPARFDNEEDEDRGRWRLARCYSSDGLGWDKTSTEENHRTNPGLKYHQSMCTGVVIGKTTAYCRTTSDSRVHEGGL